MAKGDDAVRKKRNKTNRKRMRNSESAVSARVASIIAAKRRRKDGKRRMCEGMCYSLPTPDDPFNDRRGKKELPKKKDLPGNRKQNGKKLQSSNKKESASEKPISTLKLGARSDGDDYGCPSKFLILCLNAIQNSWTEEGVFDESAVGPLVASSWGVEFWRCCSAGSNVLDTSGGCASREQVAWLVSTASDIVARKEKQGLCVSSPFLLFLVPSQEKAAQVRSVCKPLKALGIHTVSLHPAAPIDHQVRGLRSCEPEFLVSTPERLLELVSLRAVDISGVSLLVLDGLKCFADLDLVDKLNFIRDSISGSPHTVVFNDSDGEVFASLAQNLLSGAITRLSLSDSLVSKSAFVQQYVHFCASEEQKISEVMQILVQTLDNQTHQSVKMLVIAGGASKAQLLALSLKSECRSFAEDPTGDSFTIHKGEKEAIISVKDGEDIEKFEIVVVVDFPSIEDYVDILTRTARHSVVGILHSFFCKADTPVAQPLIEVLMQCGQIVPEEIRNLGST
ncbi:DEAD-box ATP-dependent RNA helicase 14 [Typha angustifolia]|uniref:DEAD-box ATP-dependent RNA helicase 14 n=1 Tax=Typha angustifolia TaxID=59011 RepID=UPI003C2B85A0